MERDSTRDTNDNKGEARTNDTDITKNMEDKQTVEGQSSDESDDELRTDGCW